MSVHFRADESGRIIPTSAEAAVDVTEEYTVKVPVSSKAPHAAEVAANATSDDEACLALANAVTRP